MSTSLTDCPDIWQLEAEVDAAYRECCCAFERAERAYAENDQSSFEIWRAMHEVARRNYRDLIAILADCSPTIH